MMNNIKIVIAAAVVASVCSCGKEQIDNTPSPVVLDDSFSLDATLESTSPDNGLKTTIGEIGGNNYAVWSASDKIDVYDKNGNKITMSIAEKDRTYARFKIESTNGLEGEFTPLYAVYPAGIGELSSKSNTLTFSTSDTQIYRDGSFADGCNVAVGTVQKINDVYSISFKNVFSYLKLNLKATADINIYKLELITHSNNLIGKKLWGDFSIADITSAAPIAKIPSDSDNGSDRIFLDCTHGPDNQPLTLKEGEVGHFVFVVPYAAFSGTKESERGFTLKVHTVPLKDSYDNDTDIFIDQIETNNSKNGKAAETSLFQRSTMVDFPEKELVSCFKVESITANNTSGKNTYISWNDGKTHSGSVKAEFVSQYWEESSHLEIPFSFYGTATNGYWLGGGESTQRWGIFTSSSNQFWSDRLITNKTSIEAISTTKRLYAKFTNKATSETEAVTESGSISFSRSGISTISFMGVDATKNYFCQNSLWYAKLYDVEVDNDGNVTSSSLIGDLVPVRRGTKSTTIDYGLYDNVQHKFFGGTTNNGTITGPHTVATE